MRATGIGVLIYFILFIYGLVAWVANLVQVFYLDFEAPYKEEVIKLIGVFVPPASMVTVWF